MRDVANRSATTDAKERHAPATGPGAPKKRTPAPPPPEARRGLASTSLALWTRRLVEATAAPGERERLLDEIDRASDGDERVPYRVVAALWERLSAGDAGANLGLRFAEQAQARDLGVTGYFASTAETLGAALRRVLRFHRLFKDPSEIAITFAPDAIRIVEAAPPGEARFPRHLAEAILATYVVLGGQWTGANLAVVAVRFQHPAPDDTRAHQRIFGRRPTFGAPENELVLPGDAAHLPLLTADSALGRYLEPVAVARLAALPSVDALLADVEKAIVEALPDGCPSIHHVARKLGLSSRSLQRRLEERSTRYQDVVDGVRHDAAVRLLAKPSLSVAEVAFLLGFSDTSGFHRAFRRWTGHPPRRGALESSATVSREGGI